MPAESAPVHDPELNAWDLESIQMGLHEPEQNDHPRAWSGRPVPARSDQAGWAGDASHDFAPAEHPTVH